MADNVMIGPRRFWQNLRRLYQLVSGTSGEIVVTETSGRRIVLSLADPLTLPSLDRLALGSQTVTLAAGDAVPIDKPFVRIVSGGGTVNLASTPSISTTGAVDGQILIVQGTDDTDDVLIKDETNLAGSKVRIHGAANLVFGNLTSAIFLFDSTRGEWVQTAYRVDG